MSQNASTLILLLLLCARLIACSDQPPGEENVSRIGSTPPVQEVAQVQQNSGERSQDEGTSSDDSRPRQSTLEFQNTQSNFREGVNKIPTYVVRPSMLNLNAFAPMDRVPLEFSSNPVELRKRLPDLMASPAYSPNAGIAHSNQYRIDRGLVNRIPIYVLRPRAPEVPLPKFINPVIFNILQSLPIPPDTGPLVLVAAPMAALYAQSSAESSFNSMNIGRPTASNFDRMGSNLQNAKYDETWFRILQGTGNYPPPRFPYQLGKTPQIPNQYAKDVVGESPVPFWAPNNLHKRIPIKPPSDVPSTVPIFYENAPTYLHNAPVVNPSADRYAPIYGLNSQETASDENSQQSQFLKSQYNRPYSGGTVPVEPIQPSNQDVFPNTDVNSITRASNEKMSSKKTEPEVYSSLNRIIMPQSGQPFPYPPADVGVPDGKSPWSPIPENFANPENYQQYPSKSIPESVNYDSPMQHTNQGTVHNLPRQEQGIPFQNLPYNQLRGSVPHEDSSLLTIYRINPHPYPPRQPMRPSNFPQPYWPVASGYPFHYRDTQSRPSDPVTARGPEALMKFRPVISTQCGRVIIPGENDQTQYISFPHNTTIPERLIQDHEIPSYQDQFMHPEIDEPTSNPHPETPDQQLTHQLDAQSLRDVQAHKRFPYETRQAVDTRQDVNLEMMVDDFLVQSGNTKTRSEISSNIQRFVIPENQQKQTQQENHYPARASKEELDGYPRDGGQPDDQYTPLPTETPVGGYPAAPYPNTKSRLEINSGAQRFVLPRHPKPNIRSDFPNPAVKFEPNMFPGGVQQLQDFSPQLSSDGLVEGYRRYPDGKINSRPEIEFGARRFHIPEETGAQPEYTHSTTEKEGPNDYPMNRLPKKVEQYDQLPVGYPMDDIQQPHDQYPKNNDGPKRLVGPEQPQSESEIEYPQTPTNDKYEPNSYPRDGIEPYSQYPRKPSDRTSKRFMIPGKPQPESEFPHAVPTTRRDEPFSNPRKDVQQPHDQYSRQPSEGPVENYPESPDGNVEPRRGVTSSIQRFFIPSPLQAMPLSEYTTQKYEPHTNSRDEVKPHDKYPRQPSNRPEEDSSAVPDTNSKSSPYTYPADQRFVAPGHPQLQPQSKYPHPEPVREHKLPDGTHPKYPSSTTIEKGEYDEYPRNTQTHDKHIQQPLAGQEEVYPDNPYGDAMPSPDSQSRLPQSEPQSEYLHPVPSSSDRPDGYLEEGNQQPIVKYIQQPTDFPMESYPGIPSNDVIPRPYVSSSVERFVIPRHGPKYPHKYVPTTEKHEPYSYSGVDSQQPDGQYPRKPSDRPDTGLPAVPYGHSTPKSALDFGVERVVETEHTTPGIPQIYDYPVRSTNEQPDQYQRDSIQQPNDRYIQVPTDRPEESYLVVRYGDAMSRADITSSIQRFIIPERTPPVTHQKYPHPPTAGKSEPVEYTSDDIQEPHYQYPRNDSGPQRDIETGWPPSEPGLQYPQSTTTEKYKLIRSNGNEPRDQYPRQPSNRPVEDYSPVPNDNSKPRPEATSAAVKFVIPGHQQPASNKEPYNSPKENARQSHGQNPLQPSAIPFEDYPAGPYGNVEPRPYIGPGPQRSATPEQPALMPEPNYTTTSEKNEPNSDTRDDEQPKDQYPRQPSNRPEQDYSTVPNNFRNPIPDISSAAQRFVIPGQHEGIILQRRYPDKIPPENGEPPTYLRKYVRNPPDRNPQQPSSPGAYPENAEGRPDFTMEAQRFNVPHKPASEPHQESQYFSPTENDKKYIYPREHDEKYPEVPSNPLLEDIPQVQYGNIKRKPVTASDIQGFIIADKPNSVIGPEFLHVMKPISEEQKYPLVIAVPNKITYPPDGTGYDSSDSQPQVTYSPLMPDGQVPGYTVPLEKGIPTTGQPLVYLGTRRLILSDIQKIVVSKEFEQMTDQMYPQLDSAGNMGVTTFVPDRRFLELPNMKTTVSPDTGFLAPLKTEILPETSTEVLGLVPTTMRTFTVLENDSRPHDDHQQNIPNPNSNTEPKGSESTPYEQYVPFPEDPNQQVSQEYFSDDKYTRKDLLYDKKFEPEPTKGPNGVTKPTMGEQVETQQPPDFPIQYRESQYPNGTKVIQREDIILDMKRFNVPKETQQHRDGFPQYIHPKPSTDSIVSIPRTENPLTDGKKLIDSRFSIETIAKATSYPRNFEYSHTSPKYKQDGGEQLISQTTTWPDMYSNIGSETLDNPQVQSNSLYPPKKGTSDRETFPRYPSGPDQNPFIHPDNHPDHPATYPAESQTFSGKLPERSIFQMSMVQTKQSEQFYSSETIDTTPPSEAVPTTEPIDVSEGRYPESGIVYYPTSKNPPHDRTEIPYEGSSSVGPLSPMDKHLPINIFPAPQEDLQRPSVAIITAHRGTKQPLIQSYESQMEKRPLSPSSTPKPSEFNQAPEGSQQTYPQYPNNESIRQKPLDLHPTNDRQEDVPRDYIPTPQISTTAADLPQSGSQFSLITSEFVDQAPDGIQKTSPRNPENENLGQKPLDLHSTTGRPEDAPIDSITQTQPSTTAAQLPQSGSYIPSSTPSEESVEFASETSHQRKPSAADFHMYPTSQLPSQPPSEYVPITMSVDQPDVQEAEPNTTDAIDTTTLIPTTSNEVLPKQNEENPATESSLVPSYVSPNQIDEASTPGELSQDTKYVKTTKRTVGKPSSVDILDIPSTTDSDTARPDSSSITTPSDNERGFYSDEMMTSTFPDAHTSSTVLQEDVLPTESVQDRPAPTSPPRDMVAENSPIETTPSKDMPDIHPQLPVEPGLSPLIPDRNPPLPDTTYPCSQTLPRAVVDGSSSSSPQDVHPCGHASHEIPVEQPTTDSKITRIFPVSSPTFYTGDGNKLVSVKILNESALSTSPPAVTSAPTSSVDQTEQPLPSSQREINPPPKSSPHFLPTLKSIPIDKVQIFDAQAILKVIESCDCANLKFLIPILKRPQSAVVVANNNDEHPAIGERVSTKSITYP